MSEPKTKPTDGNVEEFIASVENEHRRSDAFTLLDVFHDATGLTPKMWGASIIGYGVYHYRSDRSTQEGDWPRVAFSPRKASMTIYITPGFDTYRSLIDQLGKCKVSKACIYINKLSDVNLEILKLIIKESLAEMNKLYPAQTK